MTLFPTFVTWAAPCTDPHISKLFLMFLIVRPANCWPPPEDGEMVDMSTTHCLRLVREADDVAWDAEGRMMCRELCEEMETDLELLKEGLWIGAPGLRDWESDVVLLLSLGGVAM